MEKQAPLPFTLPFRLEDLEPKETIFYLSKVKVQDGTPQPLTLSRWSLRVRDWTVKKFGRDMLQEIFSQQKVAEIAAIAWFMLKEKNLFTAPPKADEDDNPTAFDGFLDSVCSVKDQMNLIIALLGAIGLGEPEIQQIAAAVDGPKKGETPDPKAPSPKKKIGAKSLTP